MKKHTGLVKKKKTIQQNVTNFVSEMSKVATNIPEKSSPMRSQSSKEAPEIVKKNVLNNESNLSTVEAAHTPASQSSEPNVSGSSDSCSIPAHVTQRHKNTTVNTVPSHLSSKLAHKDIFIGNLSKQVPLATIVQYLESHSLTVHQAFLLPSKKFDCNGVKVNISGTNKILNDDAFLPRGAYARKWYPANQNY
jgi:hypothetical protein